MSRWEGEEGAPEPVVASPGRIRAARRRWRLWWRFQLRRLGRRGLLRRIKPLREPGEDVAFSGAQLWIGRRFGSVYLLGRRVAERARIERSQIPDRAEPVRTTVGLVREQRGLLVGLLALIVIGLALDSIVRATGSSVASGAGIESWLRETFTRPGDDTIRNLLAAAAAGTATILGLVLSISLIVWQTTADRYRSTTIVGFLLRERTGTAVVRLLALGFAYSLWVLALFEVAGRPAYVSALIALLLSTIAVLSLIGYRELGLLGYLPGNIARRLSADVIREQRRASAPWAGESVADRSRRVVAADLQIFDDLVAHLLDEGDADDAAVCLNQLRRAVTHCVIAKPSLQPDSRFFERRREPLRGGGAVGLQDGLASDGLMTPMTEVPDHLWVERRAMAIGDKVRESPLLLESNALFESLFALWAMPLQYAWHGEDDDAVGLVFDHVESLAADDRVLGHPKIVERLATVAWLLIEGVGGGHTVGSDAIVDSKPWTKASRRGSHFPWRAQTDARELGRRIRNEIDIAGEIVSPRWAMIEDVEGRRGVRLREQQLVQTGRAISLCGDLLVRASDSTALSAPTAASMTIRVILRAAHHDLDVSAAEAVAAPLMKAVAQTSGETADELRDDIGRLARVCAERGEWSLAYGALDVAARAGVIARIHQSDERRALVLLFDTLFLAALVYAWGEFHLTDEHEARTVIYVQHPFADLDRLDLLLKDRVLHQLMLPMVRYYQWFQPLQHRLSDLPTRYVDDGGIGYGEEVDHPSELIASSELMFGPDECLTTLIDAAVEGRQRKLKELAALLGQLAGRRG